MTTAKYPFQRQFPGNLAPNQPVPADAFNYWDQAIALGADGSLWTDIALLKNITTTTVANRLGPLLYVPRSLLAVGSSTLMSFGLNGGNPEGSFCPDGRNVWFPLASMVAGVGLQPLCAAASPNGLIVVVGGLPGSSSTQKIRRSADGGSTWAIQNVHANGGGLASVQTLDWFQAGNLWVGGFDTDSLGTGGHLETSPDGITWTPRTTPNTDPRWQGAVSPTAMVITSSASTSKAIRSVDGINWTEVTLPSTGAWKAVAWSDQGSRFLALRPGAAAWSADGVTWSNSGVTAPAQLTTIAQVVASGRLWLALGSAGSHCAVYYSVDGGGTWQSVHVVVNTGTQTRAMAVAGDQLAWKDATNGHHLSMRSGF